MNRNSPAKPLSISAYSRDPRCFYKRFPSVRSLAAGSISISISISSQQSPLVSDPDIDSIHFTIADMPVPVVGNAAPLQLPGADVRDTQPQPCSLLSIGQAFTGTQNVSSIQKDEAWRVNVRVQAVDLERGYLCGTMEALNVPMADTPVVTFWEGEIVDTKNYTFFTGKWDAKPDNDIKHWSLFPSFEQFKTRVEIDGGRSLDLSNHEHIYMRWKEQYFVNVGFDCGLTIAGFYYVCFSCIDGSINGFYYDPNSTPFQRLELKTMNEGRSGFSSSSYEFQ